MQRFNRATKCKNTCKEIISFSRRESNQLCYNEKMSYLLNSTTFQSEESIVPVNENNKSESFYKGNKL